jgi:hypothetical protein
MRPLRLARPVALALVAALTHPAPPAQACASVTRPAEVVEVAAERAIIVWDAARRVEHFIRAAAFETTARDFGFLVPTPSVPTLAAETSALFDRLAAHSRPPVIVRHPWVLSPTLSCMVMSLRSSPNSISVASVLPESQGLDPVRVLSEQQVAGYNAVVLEASDPAALSRWLTQHEYATTPELTAWLAPYVARGWKLTAFKVASRDANEGGPPSLAPVRMTFAADAPYYPYREPVAPRPAAPSREIRPRRLEVHVVSDQRLDGTIGSTLTWPGRVTYSGPADLGPQASAWGLSPGLTRLTSFLDASSPRPATDEVFFRPAADQSRFTPPPIYRDEPREIPLPLDLLALGGVATALVLRSRARARAKRTASQKD